MKKRRIMAVFYKQLMDTSNNRSIIINFLTLPIVVLFLTFSLHSQDDNVKLYVVIMMSTMFTGMIPIITISNIIGMDKYTNSLRMLIMSTVKPLEYLIGITANILFVSLIPVCILGLEGGLYNIKLLCFIGVMLVGIGTTLLLGSAMAMKSGSGNLIILVSIINGFIPVMGALNPLVYKLSKFLYTQQIGELISDISGNYYGNFPYRFFIIGINFIIFLVLFMISYKRNRFNNEK